MLSSIPLPHFLSPILLLTTSIFLVTSVFYLLFRCFYNLFLHPLRSYPGPLLWRISDLPFSYSVFRGTAAIRVAELHRQYGPELRTCPNRLSFTDPQAIKDVLAHVPGKPEFAKETMTLPPNGVASILAARKDKCVVPLRSLRISDHFAEPRRYTATRDTAVYSRMPSRKRGCVIRNPTSCPT